MVSKNLELAGGLDLQGLSLKDRAAILGRTKVNFANHIHDLAPDFAVLLHGSAVYAVGENPVGTEDSMQDLDTFLVVKRDMVRPHSPVNYRKFVGAVQELVDVNATSLPTFDDYQQLVEGGIRLRMEGHFQSVPIRFNALTVEALRQGRSPFGIDKPYPGKLPNLDKYKNTPKGEIIGKAERIVYPPEFEELDDNWLKVPEYFSRRTTDANGVPRMTSDHLSNKFIHTEVLYDPGLYIAQLHNNAWRSFIRTAIFYNPGVSDVGILNSVFRAPRFSDEYREQVQTRIQRERQSLERRRRG